jgi:hypothetical protein
MKERSGSIFLLASFFFLASWSFLLYERERALFFYLFLFPLFVSLLVCFFFLSLSYTTECTSKKKRESVKERGKREWLLPIFFFSWWTEGEWGGDFYFLFLEIERRELLLCTEMNEPERERSSSFCRETVKKKCKWSKGLHLNIY